MQTLRRFTDAPQAERCAATVHVARSKETAQCGRFAKVGGYCRQHAAIEVERWRAKHILEHYAEHRDAEHRDAEHRDAVRAALDAIALRPIRHVT